MKTVKRVVLTAATVIALSGLAFGAEETTNTTGGNTGSTCTDCFDP